MNRNTQVIATRRALRAAALMSWLVATVAAAGLAWALSALWPSLIYPATPGAVLPECSVTLPETQVRAGEQRT